MDSVNIEQGIGYGGSVSTPSYHHGNLREALVEAAVEAARERGTEGLAVRELARRVGVSHNAAYRHFADRDALVEEVAARGLAALVTAMERRLEGLAAYDDIPRARRTLAGCGRGYVDFAVDQPGLFRVLFTAYPEPPGEKAGGPVDDHDPFGMLNAALDDLVTVGFLAPHARLGAEITCWSAVHGFSVLHTEGPLRELPAADREVALGQMMVAIDRGYGATTGTQWPALRL